MLLRPRNENGKIPLIDLSMSSAVRHNGQGYQYVSVCEYEVRNLIARLLEMYLHMKIWCLFV
jgi:hypothetical protein